GEAGVAELGLWPHGAERERTVLDVDELGVALLALDLEVREHRLTTRAPVDDVVVAIDQLLGIQAHEDLAHGARQAGVHREALVRPIAGGAEPLELAYDRAAGLLLPAPHAAQELLTADLVLRLTLGGELALHDHLGRDARVVGAGDPEGVEALHALHAHHDVLQGDVERVSHVQRARDVRRRDDDRERLLLRRELGPEVAVLLPDRIPARLDGSGLVAIGDGGGVVRRVAHARCVIVTGSVAHCITGAAAVRRQRTPARRNVRFHGRRSAPVAAIETVSRTPSAASHAGSATSAGSRARRAASGMTAASDGSSPSARAANSRATAACRSRCQALCC